MTKTKPKIYPAEFKESAVKLAIESKRPVSQTAKELGITRTTLYTWVDKYSKPQESMMRTDEHLYDELKRLKKDLARVTQERDLLKKAAAYFAKESQ
jgi:transposase